MYKFTHNNPPKNLTIRNNITNWFNYMANECILFRLSTFALVHQSKKKNRFICGHTYYLVFGQCDRNESQWKEKKNQISNNFVLFIGLFSVGIALKWIFESDQTVCVMIRGQHKWKIPSEIRFISRHKNSYIHIIWRIARGMSRIFFLWKMQVKNNWECVLVNANEKSFLYEMVKKCNVNEIGYHDYNETIKLNEREKIQWKLILWFDSCNIKHDIYHTINSYMQ